MNVKINIQEGIVENRFTRLCAVAFTLAMVMELQASGVVSGVAMRQLEPWNGLVAIDYELVTNVVPAEGEKLVTEVTVKDVKPANGTFLTDKKWNVDISTSEGQPFRERMIRDSTGRVTYDEILNAFTPFVNALDTSGLIGLVDYVMLYDYLDDNNVPVSLALPCVERVPMVVGLTPPQFSPTKFEPTGDGETKTWHFDAKAWFDDSREMQAVIAFPFRHGESRASKSYKAQAFVKLVYAPAWANKATLGAVVRPSKTDWMTPGRRMENGILSFLCLSKEMSFTVPGTVADEEHACISENKGLLSFHFGDFTPNLLPSSVDVLKMETVPVGEKAGDGTQEKKKKVYTVLVSPLDDKGAAAFPVGQAMEAGDFNTAAGSVFVPHVFVWVRIVNSQGKTVDLVPAGFQDDEDVAGKSLSLQLSHECGALVGEATGPGKKPAFEFVSTVPQTELSLATIAADTGSFGSGGADWSPKAIYAVDPRFNAQPEHWYAVTNANVSFGDWLEKTKAALADNDVVDRDQDIFLFNSNQGILQSIGELTFLPYLHVPGDSVMSFSFASVSMDGNGVPGANVKTVLNRFGYLWRTYDADECYRRCAASGIGRNSQFGTNYVAKTFTTEPTYEAGKHRLVWNAAADGVAFASTCAVCRIDILPGSSSSFSFAGLSQISSEEVKSEIFGTGDASPVTLNLTTRASFTAVSGENTTLDVGLDLCGPIEGESELLLDGEQLLSVDSPERCDWTVPEFCGIHEFRHRTLVDGTVVGTSFVVTCEVWAIDAAFDRADLPLRELLPERHEEVRSIRFSEDVRDICSDFLDGCPHVRSLVIPSSVTNIGEHAFAGCSVLESIYVDVGDKARILSLIECSHSGVDMDHVELRYPPCTVRFDPGDGSGSMEPWTLVPETVGVLPKCLFEAPSGKMFRGWIWKEKGRFFDDQVLVFNLALRGETITLTAVWW